MRDILTASENWATGAHFNKFHNGLPTFNHLVEVVSKIYTFEDDDEVVSAGWLHDMLKYTDTKAWEISKTLSRRVARIVELVTDPDAPDRATAKAKLYENLMKEPDLIMRADAAFVKCVDRFCNQRFAINTLDDAKLNNYVAEFPDFIRYFGNAMMHPTYRVYRQTLWVELFRQYEDMVKVLQGDLR